MTVSLSEAMQVAGGVFEEEFSYEPEEFCYAGVMYPFSEKKPVKLRITNLGDRKVKIELEGEVTLSLPCDRCLREVAVSIPFQTEREVDFSVSEEERAADLDETNFINGYDLDVDAFVCEEILLGFPMKVLCQEDCKGICKVCGANLNEGECGCDRTELDPRMSVIRDIFNNFKEV
ncbi:MAG: DUF177 domain-containing protein [Lachnospiraceae bacterium]|nr:DUF177 domain-containing protein [Lachnospiraceae bacterium]